MPGSGTKRSVSVPTTGTLPRLPPKIFISVGATSWTVPAPPAVRASKAVAVTVTGMPAAVSISMMVFVASPVVAPRFVQETPTMVSGGHTKRWQPVATPT